MEIIKKKIFILLIVNLFVLIGFIILTIFLFGLIKRQSNQFVEISKSLKLLELKREQFDIYKSKFEQNQKDFKKINNLFLNKNEVLKFFNFIETISLNSKNYVNMSVINPDEKIKDSLKIQISLYGSFSNFMKFLSYLENAPYLLQIEDLKIRRLSLAEILQMKQMVLREGDIGSNLIIQVYTR